MNSFWKNSVLQWEKSRYDSFFSKWFYFSLHNRQALLTSLLSQIPEGAHVVELGCGSGRSLSALGENQKFKYTGVDISPEAIQIAKEIYKGRPNTEWICAEVKDLKNLKADYAFSVGLMDWITDEEFNHLIQNNSFQYHAHSFSMRSETLLKQAHRLFTKIIRLNKNAFYSPRDFTEETIRRRFQGFTSIRIFQHAKLSFGAFIHNLPTQFSFHFQRNYFQNKKKGLFETLFKKLEVSLLEKENFKLSQKVILEVGSGEGTYTQIFLGNSPKRLVSIDPYIDTSQYIQHQNFAFYPEKLESFSTSEKFDAIFALGSLEFLDDVKNGLGRKLDLLKEEGQLIFFLPRKDQFIYRIYRWYHKKINNINLQEMSLQETISLINRLRPSFQVQVKSAGLLNDLVIARPRE